MPLNNIPEADALMWQFAYNMGEMSRAIQRMAEAIDNGNPELEKAMNVFEEYARERERRRVADH